MWTPPSQRDLDLSPPSLKGKQDAAMPEAFIYLSYLSKKLGRDMIKRHRDMIKSLSMHQGVVKEYQRLMQTKMLQRIQVR